MNKRQLIAALAGIRDDAEIHVNSTGKDHHPEAREVLAVDFHNGPIPTTVVYIRGHGAVEIRSDVTRTKRVLHSDYPQQP